MRRETWVHLLAAYLSIGASAAPDNSSPDLHSAPPMDPLPNVRLAWSLTRSNTHSEHVRDKEKRLNRRSSAPGPRRYASGRRRRRVHP